MHDYCFGYDMYNVGRTLDDFKPGSGPNLPPLELEPP